MKPSNYFVFLLSASFHKKRVFLSSGLLKEQREKELWDYSLYHAQELSGAHRSAQEPYTLFQSDRHLSILLFSCKLALVASFSISKFKRIFSP